MLTNEEADTIRRMLAEGWRARRLADPGRAGLHSRAVR